MEALRRDRKMQCVRWAEDVWRQFVDKEKSTPGRTGVYG